MNEKLRKRLSDVFETDIDKINEESSPDTIEKWDSVHHLYMIMAIEEGFNIKLTDEETMQLVNCRMIELILKEKGI
jgi:acyl carrier protein